MEPLEIDARVARQPVRRSGPCPVEVRITNRSSAPVLMNRRLAVGYRGSQARELFAELFQRGSDVVVSSESKLYERDLAAAAEYAPLAPGEAMATEFDLCEWYGLPGPGGYELVVSYQADEALAPKLPGLLPGIHASSRVPLRVGP